MWKDRCASAEDHLERRDHQKQASHDRDAWRDSNHREQQYDDSERPLVQAAN
jgi:hypothetical protein